jgi:GNAT superfamily N-acetyltransferase
MTILTSELGKKQLSKKKYVFSIFSGHQLTGTCLVIKSDKLEIANLTKIELGNTCWVIDEIEIKEGFRGFGSGTRLLQYTIKELQDMAKLPIVLMPPLSEYTERILLWYKRHGFKPTDKRYWQRDVLE